MVAPAFRTSRNSRPSVVWASVLLVAACTSGAPTAHPPTGPTTGPTRPVPSVLAPTDATGQSGRVILLGKIVTLAEPAVAEAIAFEHGRVMAVGSRDEVMALADEQTEVIELGDNVAYPGFIDAHAHWIGDRDYYGPPTAPDAVDAALSRGWTSISEQWVNRERFDELERLAADAELRIRVDAYLALNEPQVGGEHFGHWYADREPGKVSEGLVVKGVKIHLDHGVDLLWEAAELNATIAAANEAGWQVSIHTVTTEAHDLVLDALETVIGPSGPNPLHHRIEHALQVTDAQLARMVAMQLPVVIHPGYRRGRLAGRSGRPVEPRRRGRLADAMARLRRRRIARGRGQRRAMDLPRLCHDR